ncbi:MAG TPA: sigma-70 family RNA polymerase sigma factor [Solirubrobacterales bacterium]|nr:sigma-70 family RNA polymerase sigma factor [Solirubrobacterales bacterium]
MSEAAAPTGFGRPVGSIRLLSDERLVRRATAGDERAFAAIFRRYHQDLFRFCMGIVGDSQDAQDALQNTMVKVMRALPGERRQIQLKPWLYRIAHNEAVEILRRRPPVESIDPGLAATSPGPSEEAEQRARLRRLVADMGELPERQRGALVMRELAGLDFDEIGAALGSSPEVARQTLYEARLSLRQMGEGRELSCDEVMRALSEADGRVTRRRDLRAHLRECRSCREFGEEARARRADFAAIAPLPAVAAVGILHGVVAAGGSSGGAAAGTAGGVAAGKAAGASALGGSVLAKSAATVAVVAAIGVTAADRGGLIDAGLPGGGSSHDASAGAEHSDVPAGPAESPAGPAGAPDSRPQTNLEQGGSAGQGGTVAPQRSAPGQTHPAPGAPDAPAPNGAPAEAPPSTAPGNSGAHRQDAGKHGNPPSAAGQGQQTASSHKGGALAPGQSKSESPGKGQGNGATQGKGSSNGVAKGKSGGAEKVHPENSQKPEPQPKAEPPPREPSPAGPESAGGGKPAPPSESPAGPHPAPPGLG